MMAVSPAGMSATTLIINAQSNEPNPKSISNSEGVGGASAFALKPIQMVIIITTIQKMPLGIAAPKMQAAKLRRPNQRRNTKSSNAAVEAKIMSKDKSALMVA